MELAFKVLRAIKKSEPSINSTEGCDSILSKCQLAQRKIYETQELNALRPPRSFITFYLLLLQLIPFNQSKMDTGPLKICSHGKTRGSQSVFL